jgi:hypothetical protein
MYPKLAVTLLFATITMTTWHPHPQTEAPGPQSTRAAKAPEPLIYEAPFETPYDTTYKAPATTSTNPPVKEDWTTISLAKSGLPLQAIGGVLLNKIELPTCTRELLRLQWRAGDPIDLYVIRPRNTEKPPVALYLYNYTSDTDVFRRDEWCRQVNETGVAMAGFVSALAGQRFHSPRPMKQWFVSELQEALAMSTHDVQMILNYLATRSDLDLTRVGMFGVGSGGSIAILAAASDPRIIALDVINPWGDWPAWLTGSQQIPEEERAAYLKPEFLRGVSGLDPATWLPQLKLKALRIEQVMDDPVTPRTAKDKIAGAAPRPSDVARYQDRAAQVKAWTESSLSEWLGEQLRPAAPKKMAATN